jgi:RHS repeat-associated protein
MFMTYTSSDSTWFTTNTAGDEVGLYGYDAYGALAFGSPTTAFGYASQYTDSSSGYSNMRARWYSSQTGEFTTVDPALSSTNSAYTYTDGDPVNRLDPTGRNTLGVCVSANGAIGPIAVGLGDCLTRTMDASGEDDIGLLHYYYGAGGAGLVADASLYYSVSNATNLQELSGPFTFATVTGTLIAGVTATVFWNNKIGSNAIYGLDLGVSLGLGVSADIGESNTTVDQFYGTISANIARGIWDALEPVVPIMNDLSKAKKAVGVAQSSQSSGFDEAKLRCSM